MTRERWFVATTEYAGLTAYTGGIGRHYAALLPALAEHGVGIDLMVLPDAAPRADARAPGVRRLDVVPVPEGRSRTAALGDRARTVGDAVRRGGYDRVFLPEWAALGSALPPDAPLLTNLATGMRLANDVSGLSLEDLPADSRPAVRLQSRLEECQIRRSAGLVAISTAMRDRVEALYGDLPPTRVVRNCIDVRGVRAAARNAALPAGWPPGQGPVVLFLGRSERRKGVVDAVDAYARLFRQRPDARLVLAGAGGDARFEPTRSGLMARLPEEARERVTWLGHVAGPELYAAIRAAAVAMCPSRWEGFGQVALEVKALGTPLVATRGSGFDDFCTDGVDSLLVPPAAPAQLAVALERVLADPVGADGRAACAAERIDAFAPEPVAADLLAAADDLLGPV
ncbi:glycosyltransferase family 4 protein [Microbacterium sp. 179-B 1A2 NHS]|uniref:glycosyltransferase family 4 protein n=1 Tax=Microbacterium sp. 179-B 1A2 NHS TaxID=3142383 RepID=UPI0039A20D25